MVFLRTLVLAFVLAPQAPSPIEIGPRCACSPAEIQTAKQAGFNRVYAEDVPATIRIGVLRDAGPSLRLARLELWKAVARGARRIALDAGGRLTPGILALGETAGVVTRNETLFAPLKARTTDNVIRIEPAGDMHGYVLESADAIVLIVLNESKTTRRVTLTFPPDLPEAIWQNMEAGNAVNFVMGSQGPYVEHTFSPHDALVLAIRKKLR